MPGLSEEAAHGTPPGDFISQPRFQRPAVFFLIMATALVGLAPIPFLLAAVQGKA